MKNIILLLGSLLFTFQIGMSQTIDKEKLNEYFQTLKDNDKFMGSVALLKDGNIIYQKSVGFSDVETNKKNDADTKYRIGSISKTFTATLILKAIEEGKLDISKTIDTYFPSIKNAEIITIENLLNHRSGIHNFTNEQNYLDYNTQKQSEEQMVEIFSKAGSDFQPNSKADYSNSNYVLLSYILQKIYKEPYGQILQEKIIKPLNLKNTYFGGAIDLTENEGYSYRYNGNWEKQSETDTSIPMGAGGIVSNPTDLLIFINALLNGKIISEQNLDTMKTIKEGYGLGLFQMPFDKKTAYGHTGGIDGFNSAFGFFPNENVGFAMTSNGANYDTNNILIAMLSIIFDKPYDIPSFKTV
jgi:D-alanyl-D-alanine carboxypeptidase